MAIETQEKVINNNVYSVTQFPARRALKIKARLIKMLGPVVAQIFITVSEGASESQSRDNIVKAIELLAEHLDEQQFEDLVVQLLFCTRKNGIELQAGIIDMEFAGDIGTLYHVLWFVLEVNYASFFQMLGIGRQSIQELNQMPSATKKTSIKTSQKS